MRREAAVASAPGLCPPCAGLQHGKHRSDRRTFGMASNVSADVDPPPPPLLLEEEGPVAVRPVRGLLGEAEAGRFERERVGAPRATGEELRLAREIQQR